MPPKLTPKMNKEFDEIPYCNFCTTCNDIKKKAKSFLAFQLSKQREGFKKFLEGLKVEGIRPTDKRVESPVWNGGWNELAQSQNKKINKEISNL